MNCNLPQLFAFGFFHLPMLGWLAAAAVPLLIHLWNRRHYRETAWAAMDFLLAAIRRNTRRLLFEQWLLLLVRMAVIVLLVFAVAGPYFHRLGLTGGGGSRHRVLVLDGSFSMAYKPADQTCFDRAKALARQIVADSSQGDVFSLVLMSSPPKASASRQPMDRTEILREIDSVQLPHATADLPGTLAAVEQLLQQVQHDHSQIARHEIYFISDLQRASWTPPARDAALDDFRRRSKSLSETAELVVLDVGQPETENLAVTSLRAVQPAVIAGREASFSAAVKNFGRQEKSRQPINFLVDGRRIERKTIDVPAGGESSVDFSHRFETPGDHAVEIHAPGDALDIDNHRYLSVPVRQAIRVLCIDGRPSGEPFRGAADYLAEALAPRGENAETATIQAEIAAESAILDSDLARFDCVFLCNVAQFTSHEVKVLRHYLQNGGNLVFFLGDQVLAERYNRELFDEGTAGEGKTEQGRAGEGASDEGRLLPARLGELRTRPSSRLDPLGYQHPIVKAFRGRGESSLLTTPIYQYFQMIVPKNSSAKVVLALADGDPLLVEKPVGRGRVLLAATSADTSWSAMPLWPSYLPLLHEIVNFCISRSEEQFNLSVGEPMAATFPSASPDVPVMVQTPNDRAPAGRWKAEAGSNTYCLDDTSQSGFYTFQFGPPINHRRIFAVNVDTAESDLARLSPGELQSEVWPGVVFSFQGTRQNGGGSAGGIITASSGNLPADLLYAALALLLLETYWAWRFGYHAT